MRKNFVHLVYPRVAPQNEIRRNGHFHLLRRLTQKRTNKQKALFWSSDIFDYFFEGRKTKALPDFESKKCQKNGAFLKYLAIKA